MNFGDRLITLAIIFVLTCVVPCGFLINIWLEQKKAVLRRWILLGLIISGCGYAALIAYFGGVVTAIASYEIWNTERAVFWTGFQQVLSETSTLSEALQKMPESYPAIQAVIDSAAMRYRIWSCVGWGLGVISLLAALVLFQTDIRRRRPAWYLPAVVALAMGGIGGGAYFYPFGKNTVFRMEHFFRQQKMILEELGRSPVECSNSEIRQRVGEYRKGTQKVFGESPERFLAEIREKKDDRNR